MTGGAVRLGRSLALGLARDGYDIALHFNTSADAAQATAEEIRSLGVRCELFPCDLSAGPEVSQLLERVRERFDNLQLLVNNASLYEAASLAQTDAALLERQFKMNCFAPFLLTRAFAQRVGRGCVVNILDNKIHFNQPQYAAYLLSKKALAELTRLAAVELAPDVRVNAIAPGVILPAEAYTAEYIAWRARGIPLNQQGSVEQLTQALRYLLENRFVTGQILTVDGGESLTNTGQNALSYQEELAGRSGKQAIK